MEVQGERGDKVLVRQLGALNMSRSARLYQVNLYTGAVTELVHHTTGVVCLGKDCLPFLAANRKRALVKGERRLKVAQRKISDQHKIVMRHAH